MKPELQFALVFFGCLITFILGLIAVWIKRGLDKYDSHKSTQQAHGNTLVKHDDKILEHTDKIKDHSQVLEKHQEIIHHHAVRISTIEAQT